MTRAPRQIRGLRLLAAAAVLGAGLSGCSVLDTLSAGSSVQPPGVFTLAIGDCLEDATVGDEVTSVPIVACTQEHDSEVFASSQVTDSAFPGSSTLDADLHTFCGGDVFTRFVGVSYADSSLETRGYYPTVESWASGDRELLCTIYDPAGRTTGSLAGAVR
ncbi:MAG: septum formation family protein [Pseudolysinimonas sp.]|uniref:septum formation family protein n=1 Tax=Pseudolysinimonas sp. TaxID=2680009 RepID=UPI0032651C30